MQLGFLLKKFVTLFVVGLYFLHVKKYRLAKTIFSLGIFLLLLFSYPPFANFLVQNLENQYPKFDYTQQVKYISTYPEIKPINSDKETLLVQGTFLQD